MKVSKQDDQVLKKAISHWSQVGLMDQDLADRLQQSYEVSNKSHSFDWKNLSLIAFFFAVSCIILATVLLLLDEWLMAVLDSLVNASDLAKFAFFVALSVGLYYLAYRRKYRYPSQVFSNETLFMFGAIGVAFALTYLSFVLGIAEGYFPILILLASLAYAGLAIQLRSKLTWFLAIGTLAVWFGTETAYRSGWEAYFLGMNFPLRYVVFGLLLLGLSWALKQLLVTRPFASLTYAIGLIGLFASLWLLSVFGNHGSYEAWDEASRSSFLDWVVLLAIGSGLAIYFGWKRHDLMTSEVGLAFLLINVYTRYFEYGWNSMHKVAFFAILAASFWFLGKKAEYVWQRLDS